MSAIAILYNRKSDKLNQTLFSNILSSLDFHGVNGKDAIHFDNISIGHQHFWTVPEEVGERQPLSVGNYCIAFDGRIDNRDELFKKLRISTGSENYSDTRLVLTCYREFGREIFKDILGSFALVLYDSIKKEVLAVRDHLGNKALYYYIDSEVFILASEEKAILSHPKVSDELNDKRIAIKFALIEKDDDSTFFKDIKELLPAHYIVVSRDKVNYKNYWNLKNSKKIRYKNENEYYEDFKDLFTESIKNSLRSLFPPVVIMSGGLDSTSVASVAADILSDRNELEKLRTASIVFGDKELSSCDESEFINEINSYYGLNSIKIDGDVLLNKCDFSITKSNPNGPLIAYDNNLYKELFAEVQKEGKVCLINGWFGDELFSYSQHWLSDLLFDGQYLKSINEIYWHLKSSGLGWLIRDSAPRIFLKELLRIKDSSPKNKHKKWLSKYSRDLINGKRPWILDHSDHNKSNQLAYILGLANNTFYVTFNESVFPEPLDIRFPFKDRRLVEFVVNIPNYLFYDKDSVKNKRILRNSLRGLMPKKITERKDATGFNLLMGKVIERNKNYIFDYLLKNGTYKKYIDTEWKDNVLTEKTNQPMEADIVLWEIAVFTKWIEDFGYVN